MATYLVTGGAGFIGSHMAEALVRRGEQVRVVDNLSTGKRQNLAHARGVEFVEGDLADLEVARQAVAGMDYVLHQAAIPSVPRSVADPVTSHRANVDATLNVLVAARDAGVKRVVFAGSSSAYGDTPTLPKHEDMPPTPLSPYALQKLVGRAVRRTVHVAATASRRSPPVLQRLRSAAGSVLAVFGRDLALHQRAHRRRAPTIFGDGEQTRDFTYVANVVDGVLRASSAPAVSGETINVATGGRISLNELYATLRDLTGSRLDAVCAPARPGDVKHSQADITRARQLLGYEPIVGLREGLGRTLDWSRSTARATPGAPRKTS